MKLAKCPYCGRRIPYFTAFMKKSEGEYFCKRCGRESNIVVRKQIFTLFASALLLSLIIMIFYLIFGKITNIIGIFLVAIPLIIFSIMSPMFLRLIPLKKYANQPVNVNQRKSQRNIQRNPQQAGAVSQETRVMPPVGEIKTRKKPIDEDIFNTIKAERQRLENSIKESAQSTKFDEILSSGSNELYSYKEKNSNDDNDDDDDIKVYKK